MEPPSIKAIETAAETYLDRRGKFQKASESVQEAKAKLIEVMQANSDKLAVDAEGSRIYKYDDEVVILSEKARVKVKAAIDEEDENE